MWFILLLTRRVDEGQLLVPALAGGMPETTLSTSDLVIILKSLICRLFGNVVEQLYSLMMEAASLFKPNTSTIISSSSSSFFKCSPMEWKNCVILFFFYTTKIIIDDDDK